MPNTSGGGNNWGDVFFSICNKRDFNNKKKLTEIHSKSRKINKHGYLNKRWSQNISLKCDNYCIALI